MSLAENILSQNNIVRGLSKWNGGINHFQPFIIIITVANTKKSNQQKCIVKYFFEFSSYFSLLCMLRAFVLGKWIMDNNIYESPKCFELNERTKIKPPLFLTKPWWFWSCFNCKYFKYSYPSHRSPTTEESSHSRIFRGQDGYAQGFFPHKTYALNNKS